MRSETTTSNTSGTTTTKRPDRILAKVGRTTVYCRAGGQTLMLRWFDRATGNYRRRSARTKDLRHALAMAADLSDALLSGEKEPDKVALGPTILEAVLAHPATAREHEARPDHHRRRMAAIEEFSRFVGSPLLRDMTVERAVAFVSLLSKQGLKAPTRTARMAGLRRASKMAPSFGQHDVLSGLRLDRRAEPLEIKALDLNGARKLIAAAREEQDPRWSGAIALMALTGLRPSEVIRLRVGDVKGDFLTVGATLAKNASSRRTLPMPMVVQEMLRPLFEDRDPQEPLVRLSSNESSALSLLGRGVGRVLRRAGFDIPCKGLRKTFASVCVNELGVSPQKMDAFIGHATSSASPTSKRHYLAKPMADALRPVSESIDQGFSHSM